MLSKSQARLFFLGGTLFFSTIFLLLTFDTMKQIPAQTHSENLSDSVKRGKAIWDKNNCMGCHTIMGEGAYYAPELTKSFPKRGAEWLKVFLKDPQAMYPGKRKMVQYNFSDAEIADVIAFLKWISEMDLNGFPPEPTIKPVSSFNPGISSAAPKKFGELCTACHMVNGKGGNVGPALDGIGKKFDAAYLEKWLSDPQSVKPGTAMPQLPLSKEEVSQMVTYLSGLK